MPEERKLVTILFTDVTGSTALGEGLDPEDLRALMGRYYAHARHIVDEHGGTLEKFIGDAVMAVFGLPQAHSNDAERALAAALALQEAVTNDAVIAGRLTLRLGVNTGPVVATTAGEDVIRGDFLVTGDAVNVAARLEQSAHSGEILVSARTAAATEASFVFGPARQISVKGKRQPLGVYPLSAARSSRQPRRPALVGRGDDLAQLDLLRGRTQRERRPQLVSLVAPAGTGKTRLLEEFLARLDTGDGWRVASARCLPYGQSLTYWPLRGLLEELLAAPVSHDAVADVYGSSGYVPEDARRLAGVALTALGVESTGQQVEREALFTAWRLLIEALAKSAPRIIVFEDLHWASESLLDLVESVMQPRTEAALLIIATSRPELLDQRPAWGGGGRHRFTALVLEPLSARETQALVGAVAEGVSEDMRAKIAERSGGNPFFALELARGLAGEDGTTENLPDTVQEALQERLDALTPRERAVLQAAAVAGRSFRPATLAAALAGDPLDMAPSAESAEVEPALEGLLARDLIMPADAGTYAFRHILVREVAYNGLSRGERIRLHLAVARWLEAFAADRMDEFVELLAYHYAEAAQLARQAAVLLEPPVDVAQAVRYLERAAALASQAGAYAEAKGRLERAIELAPEAERRRLYEALGDQIGVNDAVFPAYGRAFELWRAEASPDPLVGARLARKRYWAIASGTSANQELTREQMLEMRAEMRRLSEKAGDEDEWWRMRVAELNLFWWSGELARDEALADLEQALAAAGYFEARGDWVAFHRALDLYAVRALTIGAWDEAEAAARRRLNAPTGGVGDRGDALTSLAWAQLARGVYGEALATVQAAVAGRRPGEPVWPYGFALSWAAYAAEFSGAWEELETLFAWQEEGWGELGRGEGLINHMLSYYSALQVALAREDRAAADQAIASLRLLWPKDAHWGNPRRLNAWLDASLRDDPAPLLALLASLSETELESMWIDPFGREILFLGERGQALPASFITLYDATPPERWWDAHRRCMAIARALADGENAALAAAIDDAEAHGLIPHAARMRIVLAQRTGDRTQLERARPVLERLGDRLFLRKLAEAQRALT
ncbi:MAG TPA: adenylate/guanylate cyclase domain-containing protein [Ktedonobacterales bacterium]